MTSAGGMWRAYTYVSALLAAILGGEAARADCQVYELPQALVANNFYSDAKGSVVDKERLAETQRKLQPIRDARDYVEKAVDDSIRYHDPAKLGCAVRLFDVWARSGALSAPLANLEALYNRPEIVLTLSLSLMKMEDSVPPGTLDAAKGWLLKLALEDAAAYRRNGKLRNNLFYWAGAMAAAAAFYDPSGKLSDFGDYVWDTAMKEAAPDGSLPQEMARGQRAMVYQGYATNALIVLDQLRRARGKTLSAAQRDTWDKILAFTQQGLCDPSTIMAHTGVSQEPVESRSLIPVTTFDLGSSRGVPACVPQPASRIDYAIGGDVPLLVQALRARRIDGRH